MNLLYITFGDNVAVHLQAAFSICSFLSRPSTIYTINVITDKPALYNHLISKVNVMPITEQELEEWKGPQQFFWRIKIKALEKVANMYTGEPIIYLDTDTFLVDDMINIEAGLRQGHSFMHENEGRISTEKGKTLKKMWKQIKDKTYEGIALQTMDIMWNAGVVAFPNNQQGKECALALALCDQMCADNVTRRLVEQYAIAVALEYTYGLKEAKASIAHYWSVKELWNEKIGQFFLHAHFSAWPLANLLEHLKTLDVKHLPIAQRTRSTNVRLKNWVDKTYPPQNKVYL